MKLLGVICTNCNHKIPCTTTSNSDEKKSAEEITCPKCGIRLKDADCTPWIEK